MTQHTKGPWLPLLHLTFAPLRVNAGDNPLADVYGRSRVNAEANARLIAAAPELLDIAERMMEVIEFAYMGAPEQPKEIAQYRAIRAKIAKAAQ